MRRRLFLLGALLTAAWRPAAALDPALVAVDYRDGTYFGSLEMTVAVPPAQALAVLTDFDRMAEFMPGLNSSRIVAREGNVYRVAQQGRAQFGPVGFNYESERRIEIVDGPRILSRGLAGSAKRMASEMQLHAVAGGTRLEYRIEIVPDSWLPGVVGRSFFRNQLAEQFTALEREMLRRQARP